jgi:hypothetical protein
MQHPAFVGGRHTGAQLTRKLEAFVLRQPTDCGGAVRPNPRRPLLHRQERTPVGIADVVYATDVLMCDLTGEPHFVVELRQAGRIALERFRHELHRDRLTQRQVVGPIHLAHAALPKPADDAIAAGEDSARLEAGLRATRRGGAARR